MAVSSGEEETPERPDRVLGRNTFFREFLRLRKGEEGEEGSKC
jgi:hypothetical protein